MAARREYELTADMCRAMRLMQLRDVLAEPVWRSTVELAERFGVSERTIQRDLGALEAMGCALDVANPEGRGNRYRYRLLRRTRSAA